MSIFSDNVDRAFSYHEFQQHGWTLEDYIHYKNLCAVIRSAIIAIELNQATGPESLEAAERAINNLIDWLTAITAEEYMIEFDFTAALRQHLYYCLNPDEPIEQYIMSEADFRCEIERILSRLSNNVSMPARLVIPYCGTRAQACSLKESLLQEYRKKQQELDLVKIDHYDDDSLYSYAKQRGKLYDQMDDLRIRIDEAEHRIHEFDDGCEFVPSQNILYVYKGTIKCERDHHDISSVTAVLAKPSDGSISLNVNYCRQCKRFFIHYFEYMHYKAVHGVLIARIVIVPEGGEVESIDMASESPLMSAGYSVSASVGYSQAAREQMLAAFVDNNVISKPEIIRYLSWFIHMNGQKHGHEIARQKWESDLRFIRNYRISEQAKYRINDVQRYPGYKKLR